MLSQITEPINQALELAKNDAQNGLAITILIGLLVGIGIFFIWIARLAIKGLSNLIDYGKEKYEEHEKREQEKARAHKEFIDRQQKTLDKIADADVVRAGEIAAHTERLEANENRFSMVFSSLENLGREIRDTFTDINTKLGTVSNAIAKQDDRLREIENWKVREETKNQLKDQ